MVTSISRRLNGEPDPDADMTRELRTRWSTRGPRGRTEWSTHRRERTTRRADTLGYPRFAPGDERARRRSRAREGVRRAGRTPRTDASGTALWRVGRATPSRRGSSSASRGVQRHALFTRLARKKISATKRSEGRGRIGHARRAPTTRIASEPARSPRGEFKLARAHSRHERAVVAARPARGDRWRGPSALSFPSGR